MKKIDFSELQLAPSTASLNARIDSILSNYAPNDPPFLSDVLAYYDNGGAHLQERLGQLYAENIADHDRLYKWRIRVLCDDFGRPVKPGEFVTRVIKRSARGRDGKIVSVSSMNASILAGRYKEDFYNERRFRVDDKGCITCTFDDATYFLNVYGVHSVSKRPLCRHPELSVDTVKCADGQQRHVHYWRYEEVPEDEYQALPVIGGEPENGEQQPARRGRKPKAEHDGIEN